MSCKHCDGIGYVKQCNAPKSYSVPCVCKRAVVEFSRKCGECQGSGTANYGGEVCRCVGCAGLGKILAPIMRKPTRRPPAFSSSTEFFKKQTLF